jgi:putative alpha-1,2-mannosidase
MENGKTFVITAKNLSDKNRFVKSATLNGVKYDKAWIEHADVAAGGELLLEMGDKPSQWGTTQLPPSGEF